MMMSGSRMMAKSESESSSMHLHAGGDGDDVLEALTQGFDMSSIEDMDPSLADGFRVVYDRECPLEIRLQDASTTPQQYGTLEAIKVKVLVKGTDSAPEAVRVELTSENDLFFHYNHLSNEAAFHTIQEQQKLMVEFADYSNVLIRMLNNCIKDPHSHLAVLAMHEAGYGRLDFIQNMEYKFVELLSASFEKSPDDVIHNQITYRYNSMKARLSMMQSRLQEVNNIVKVKNPSLLLQLQKTAPPAPLGMSTKSRK